MPERRYQSKILCFQLRSLLTSLLSISLFQLRARFSIDDAPQLSLALVIKLLSFCYPNFKFDLPMLDVDTRDDQRHPVRGCRLVQLVYLASMQQELSSPQRIVIVDVAMRIGRDVRIEKPGLAITNGNVRLLQLNATVKDTLHFGPNQRRASFVLCRDVIIVKSRAIRRQNLLFSCYCHHACLIERVTITS